MHVVCHCPEHRGAQDCSHLLSHSLPHPPQLGVHSRCSTKATALVKVTNNAHAVEAGGHFFVNLLDPSTAFECWSSLFIEFIEMFSWLQGGQPTPPPQVSAGFRLPLSIVTCVRFGHRLPPVLQTPPIQMISSWHPKPHNTSSLSYRLTSVHHLPLNIYQAL